MKYKKSLLSALILGAMLAPAITFAHDSQRRWDAYHDWGRQYGQREARPGDPGYYCHRHQRRIHKDDVRRHCHSIYNDEHNIYSHRRRGSSPWWSRW